MTKAPKGLIPVRRTILWPGQISDIRLLNISIEALPSLSKNTYKQNKARLYLAALLSLLGNDQPCSHLCAIHNCSLSVHCRRCRFRRDRFGGAVSAHDVSLVVLLKLISELINPCAEGTDYRVACRASKNISIPSATMGSSGILVTTLPRVNLFQ